MAGQIFISNQLLNTTGDRVNYRVILLEDRETDLPLFKQTMKQRGYEIIDYQESVSRINDEAEISHSAGILLIDITQPFINGYRFTEEINHGHTRVKNIAVISGFIDDDDLPAIMTCGARIFPKPFDLISLLDWLEGKNNSESIDFAEL